MTHAEPRSLAAALLIAAAVVATAGFLWPRPRVAASIAPAPVPRVMVAPAAAAPPIEGERDTQADLHQQMLLDPLTGTFSGG